MPTKLQGAGRRYLLRLVYELGPDEAVRMLRAIADEIEALMRDHREHAGDTDRHHPRDA
jgi:hypothetical protein